MTKQTKQSKKIRICYPSNEYDVQHMTFIWFLNAIYLNKNGKYKSNKLFYGLLKKKKKSTLQYFLQIVDMINNYWEVKN